MGVARTDDWEVKLQADVFQQFEAVHVCGRSRARACQQEFSELTKPNRQSDNHNRCPQQLTCASRVLGFDPAASTLG